MRSAGELAVELVRTRRERDDAEDCIKRLRIRAEQDHDEIRRLRDELARMRGNDCEACDAP